MTILQKSLCPPPAYRLPGRAFWWLACLLVLTTRTHAATQADSCVLSCEDYALDEERIANALNTIPDLPYYDAPPSPPLTPDASSLQQESFNTIPSGSYIVFNASPSERIIVNLDDNSLAEDALSPTKKPCREEAHLTSYHTMPFHALKQNPENLLTHLPQEHPDNTPLLFLTMSCPKDNNQGARIFMLAVPELPHFKGGSKTIQANFHEAAQHHQQRLYDMYNDFGECLHRAGFENFLSQTSDALASSPWDNLTQPSIQAYLSNQLCVLPYNNTTGWITLIRTGSHTHTHRGDIITLTPQELASLKRMLDNIQTTSAKLLPAKSVLIDVAIPHSPCRIAQHISEVSQTETRLISTAIYTSNVSEDILTFCLNKIPLEAGPLWCLFHNNTLVLFSSAKKLTGKLPGANPGVLENFSDEFQKSLKTKLTNLSIAKILTIQQSISSYIQRMLGAPKYPTLLVKSLSVSPDNIVTDNTTYGEGVLLQTHKKRFYFIPHSALTGIWLAVLPNFGKPLVRLILPPEPEEAVETPSSFQYFLNNPSKPTLTKQQYGAVLKISPLPQIDKT